MFQSYAGGCFFGLIMLVFSRAFAGPQPFMTGADISQINKPKHNNFNDLYKSAKSVCVIMFDLDLEVISA